MYKKRDEVQPVVQLPSYNDLILRKFLRDKYPNYYLKRIKLPSYGARKSKLEKALSFIPHISLDSDIGQIQTELDKAKKTIRYSNGKVKHYNLSQDLNIHKEAVRELNALLKYMGRKDKLLPFRFDPSEINYLTEEQFDKLVEHIKEPEYKILVGVCFWTGMRFGEALPITEKDLLGSTVLKITKQWTRENKKEEKSRKKKLEPTKPDLPKNYRKRRIFLDHESKYWLNKWIAIPVQQRKNMQHLNGHLDKMKTAANQIRKTDPDFPPESHIDLYCLRHSRAVYLASRGVSIDMIAKILGNSIATCQKHYSGFILTTEDESLVKMKLDEADTERTIRRRKVTEEKENNEIALLKAQIAQLKEGKFHDSTIV
tara:strand:- start:385 stop:1497 length:1113 start_codon:yes stop_codon:yes gene_type:complete